MQIGTERENFLFFFLAQHARALSFPPFELRFCSGEIAQAFFPLVFECHESVFRVQRPKSAPPPILKLVVLTVNRA